MPPARRCCRRTSMKAAASGTSSGGRALQARTVICRVPKRTVCPTGARSTVIARRDLVQRLKLRATLAPHPFLRRGEFRNEQQRRCRSRRPRQQHNAHGRSRQRAPRSSAGRPRAVQNAAHRRFVDAHQQRVLEGVAQHLRQPRRGSRPSTFSFSRQESAARPPSAAPGQRVGDHRGRPSPAGAPAEPAGRGRRRWAAPALSCRPRLFLLPASSVTEKMKRPEQALEADGGLGDADLAAVLASMRSAPPGTRATYFPPSSPSEVISAEVSSGRGGRRPRAASAPRGRLRGRSAAR